MEMAGEELGGMALKVLLDRLVAAKMRAVRSLAMRLGRPDPFMGSEADRLASVRATAMPPVSCGPDMPLAPARGEVVAYAPRAMMPLADGGYEEQHVGFRGRDALRAKDALDRIEGLPQSLARQGREYATRVERHSARGMRCISVESMMAGGAGGGGGQRDFADVLLLEASLIARLRAAIGDGLALEIRRQGRKRSAITVRRLVDMVCLEGRTLDAVLKVHGWSAKGDHRGELRNALAAALDRMAKA